MNKNNEKLAIKGGSSVRDKKIYYGKQCLDKSDIDAVVRVLRSDWLTQGPEIKLLEEDLMEYTNAKTAVAVANGTVALHLACIAVDIQEGDEVITSPLTFAASANCIRYCGGTVRFADVNPNTYNIEPASIEKLINSKTKAIIAVDYAGQPADYDSLRKICDKYHIPLIEDAAHAIGSVYKHRKIGSIADITTFSFHPVKTITGGEGGAVLTNSKYYSDRIRLAANHGISKEKQDFLNSFEGEWHYEQSMLGFNYRITDIQSALIRSQLKKIKVFKERRRHIVEQYNHAFAGLRGLVTPIEEIGNDSCWHLYTIQINRRVLHCSRRDFYEALKAENIQTQVHYIPVYWHPYYSSLGYEKGLCKNAEQIYEQILSLPLYPGMSEHDVNDVIVAVKKIHAYYEGENL